MRLPARPSIYEINTAVWLRALGEARGRGPLRLDEVPAAIWDELAALPIDAVWLMGVWQRSPAGRHIVHGIPGQMESMRGVLPDLGDDDVYGSPYCIRDYVVDARFGGTEALAVARRELARRQVGLILDFVPNHVAPDHRWLREAQERLIVGTAEDHASNPDSFIEVEGCFFARGRDRYFPAWPDVVQLNAFSPDLRAAAIAQLSEIASQCDGVRCDMAMLMCNEVFAKTWGDRAGQIPERDYWPHVITAVREVQPDFSFIAEAYWDMEWQLQQQGFDYCYDKRLYDRLLGEDAESVRSHLQADHSYQDGLVRFIENHDEPRAARTFGRERGMAAAVVASTVPGARLYHQGQFEGYGMHVPVFLGRGPRESTDAHLRRFYSRLLREVQASGLREANWSLADVRALPADDSWRSIVAWSWEGRSGRHLVAVNLSATDAHARVRASWFDDLSDEDWILRDLLGGRTFLRKGDELSSEGLYIGLGPWQFHMFALEREQQKAAKPPVTTWPLHSEPY